MRNTRWRLAVVAALCAVALATVAATAQAHQQASTIKIGTIMSLTGPLAVFGIPEKQAIQLAFKQANAAGGINGHRIEWKVYDPAGDTAQGVSLTRRLLDNDHVQVVVGGGASSGVALAMNQILTPRGVFFASGEADPGITDPVSSNPTTFQTTARSSTVVDRLLSYAKSQGATTVGVMGDTGAFGQSGITAANALAPKYGITIKSVSYSATSTDLTSQLKQLADGGAKAIIVWTAGPSGVIAIKNAAALNLSQMIMTAHSYANPTFMKQAGSASKGVIVPVVNATVYHQATAQVPAKQKKQILAFANLYRKSFNQEINIYAAEAYDAANVALRALRLTKGDTDAKKMSAALEKAGNFVGVMGTFHFSSNDHYGLPANDLRIAKWSGAGWVLQKQ
jgi:branched-chain amino acid transport system substrate-binding protein